MTYPSQNPTLYEILNLLHPTSSSRYSKVEIKQAYRLALLRHHPDKMKEAPDRPSLHLSSKQDTPVYTVDEISLAYKVLSDPIARAEYDRSLQPVLKGASSEDYDAVFHTGLDTIDLDDMHLNDAMGLWYSSCRCGDTQGFQLTELELDKATEDGEREVITGCKGCSLWLRVLFAVSD